MNQTLLISPEAEADLNEAYQWYEEQASGLGGEFLLCVDAAMASIERTPQLYPVLYKDIVRRALLRRFPYGVFFIEGARIISVIGVLHAKQNPQVWQNRT